MSSDDYFQHVYYIRGGWIDKWQQRHWINMRSSKSLSATQMLLPREYRIVELIYLTFAFDLICLWWVYSLLLRVDICWFLLQLLSSRVWVIDGVHKSDQTRAYWWTREFKPSHCHRNSCQNITSSDNSRYPNTGPINDTINSCLSIVFHMLIRPSSKWALSRCFLHIQVFARESARLSRMHRLESTTISKLSCWCRLCHWQLRTIDVK